MDAGVEANGGQQDVDRSVLPVDPRVVEVVEWARRGGGTRGVPAAPRLGEGGAGRAELQRLRGEEDALDTRNAEVVELLADNGADLDAHVNDVSAA